MKVKDLLKKSSCTRYRVYLPDLSYVYIVDYLSKKPDYFGKQFCNISSTVPIPKEVLNLKVELFATYERGLVIYTEQKQKVRDL